MKFKEIKPGMVIHCPKEEDAKALLKHLKELGYSWLIKGDLASVNYWTRYGESTVYYLNDKKHVTFSSTVKAIEIEHKTITEFSDLLEPDDSPTDSDTGSPMSAKEIICWLEDNKYTGGCADVFGSNNMEYIFSSWSGDTIVEAITTYEAAKKAPKPVEVEWVDICRIIQIQDNGVKKCVYEEDVSNTPSERDLKGICEDILKKYISEQDGK